MPRSESRKPSPPADPASPGGRLSLPKGARVTRSREVRRAFDSGRSAASGPLVVYAYDRTDGRPARVALVVGRRWGGAVRRNRIRRLLREAFRTARPSLPPGHDLVLLPRAALHDLAMPTLRERLLAAAADAAARLARDGPRAGPPRERRRR